MARQSLGFPQGTVLFFRAPLPPGASMLRLAIDVTAEKCEASMPAIRYEHVHHNRPPAAEARSIQEVIELLERQLSMFKRWQEKGIELDPHGVGSGYAIYFTYDEQVAGEEGFDRLRTEAGNQLPRR
jgi:hypothetical protein